MQEMTRRAFVGSAGAAAVGLALAGGAAFGGDALGEETSAGKDGSQQPVAAVAQPAPSFRVDVYDFEGQRLHAFATQDALGDVCYIVESEQGLVGIEMPPFTVDLDAWKVYIEGLGKPLEAVFTDSHAVGIDYLEGITVIATQNAVDSQASGSVRATTDGLAATFGADFHADAPKVTRIVEAGMVEVAGVSFEVLDDGDTYRLAIPSMNAIYTHMLGATTHSIFVSREAMDAMVEQLKEYQAKGYALILTSHGLPEGQDAVAAKIAYVEKVGEIADECSTAEEFIDAMNAEFPGYDGANYLEMSAGYLFPEA